MHDNNRKALRCKLIIGNKTIQQEMRFSYLHGEISSYGGVVGQQVTNASRVTGCINDKVWRNVYLTVEIKSRIYEAVIRLIIAYTTETQRNTPKTCKTLETAEMKVIHRITRK